MLLKILRRRRGIRNFNRALQIVNVFIKHGFGQFIEQINLHRLLPFRKRLKILAAPPVPEKNIAYHLRKAFEELGPSFIKLAQILSSRPDLITQTFSDEFKKLLDEVPSFPFSQAKKIVEEDLSSPIDRIFSMFNEVPIAAASIAQVHEASLMDGTSVVVKIQRPNIREIIETDIQIMTFIASLMAKYLPEASFFNPVGIVEEFSRTIRRELDFIEEARNISRFRKNFADNPDIFIPEVHNDLISGRIIVMDRIEGVSIDDIDAITELGLDRRELAKKGVAAYFKMIFEDGYFHGDPHPGNIFAMPDGRIGLVDFGIVGWLPPEIIEGFAGSLVALVRRDFDTLIDNYIDLGLYNEDIDIEDFRREFKTDLITFFVPLYDKAISEINITDYLDTLTHLANKHKIRIPSDLLLVNKTMLILDSIGRLLDPGFNFIAFSEPYAEKLVRKKYSPERLLARGRKYTTELSDFLITTPKHTQQILKKILRNDIQLNMNVLEFEKVANNVERSANRLAFAVIVASLIIGSSILLPTGIGFKIWGIPIIALLGFFASAFLGFMLIYSIIRSGRL